MVMLRHKNTKHYSLPARVLKLMRLFVPPAVLVFMSLILLLVGAIPQSPNKTQAVSNLAVRHTFGVPIDKLE